MEVTLDDLKNLRQAIINRLNRENKFFESVDKTDNELIINIKLRLEKVEPLWDEFGEIQAQIEANDNEVTREQHNEEREMFENKYFKLVSKMKACVSEFDSHENGSDVSASNNENRNMNVRINNVKLPAIKLPIFDGQYCNWLEFKELFTALVHEDSSLSEIQKFYYLKGSLSEQVKDKLKTIEVSARNYEIAWKFLIERYENKELIIHNHIKQIFELPVLKVESYIGLRNLFDSTLKNLGALRSLGEKTENWDRIILYILGNKFDEVTRREWGAHKCKSALRTLTDLEEFLRNKCEILEKLEITGTCSRITKNNVQAKNHNFSKSFASINSDKNYKCYFCEGNHRVFQCEELLKFKGFERSNQVKNKKLCLNCLRPSHPSWKCNSSKCGKCGRPHNTILHVDSQSNNYEQAKNVETTHIKENTANSADLEKKIESTTLTTLNEINSSQVLLPTARVKVKINKNTWIYCRALLDSASQSSFVTEVLANKLNANKLKLNHAVNGLGEKLTQIKEQIDIEIKSCHKEFNISVRCLILPKITGNIPTITFDSKSIEMPSDLNLADPEFNKSNEIDILLGSTVFWAVLCNEKKQFGKNGPFLQNTQLGWVLGGNLQSSIVSECNNISGSYVATDAEHNIQKTLINFWNLEEVENKERFYSESEKYCESYFERTTIRDDTGRFIVKIPFKELISELGSSYGIALHRFELLETKLMKNKQLKLEYTKFMKEYKDLNHMSEIKNMNELDYSDGYFLPHHAVIKGDSLTTKCRVVFDASAKTSSGLSLNDVQYIGPTLQQEVFSILIRFRQHKIVMTSDISKMYRQILIDKNQQKYQRILWRAEPTEQLKIYELNRVTYGNASSPYLAVRCLIQLANENENLHSRASEVIKNDFYMDDLLTGADDETELLQLQAEISSILASAGLELRKWLCSSKKILNKFHVNNNLDVSVLNIGENEASKTLGIYWDSNSDTIKYRIKTFKSNIITKREILSVICQIFDPLGLLGPIIIRAKLIMQELWKLNLNWDSVVPTELQREWVIFQEDLFAITKFKIMRQVVLGNSNLIELHGFCDSSEKAYGACVYVRCILADKTVTNLICAKSRVAPIKSVSLPRLELCGAVLLAKLVERVMGALKVKFNNIYLWSDSTIVLSWIKGDPYRWKTFVANRVSEIQSLSDKNNWFHVCSEENPADLLSRGTSAERLEFSNLWWHGPSWFNKNSTEWNLHYETVNVNIPEQKPMICAVVGEENNVLDNLINTYSSIMKLQRVLAYVLRFINNLKTKGVTERIVGAITPIELEISLNTVIKRVQITSFPEEYASLKGNKTLSNKSNILCLNPFIENDLIRVGGRLRNSQQMYDKKFPIILPKNNKLTEMILRYTHERLLHCGAQALLCAVRDRYWPVSGRSSCKKIIKKCIICFKANPTEVTYLMGDLPSVRVTNYLPFLNVGVDYGGPFLTKDRKTRGSKLLKSYVCLFICMCTKAVHLELVSELTTEAFLAALSRFVNRRGKPNSIYSDNGLNFVGANNELSKINEFLKNNNEQIENSLAKDGISWKFIPPRAPNFGGIWEAGIKSTKYHIKRLVTSPLTFEEFNTLLVQVEGILNSRPLCPLTEDPDDLTALTPAHFLIGRQITALPEINHIDVPENRLKNWQRIQAIAQHYWKRWSKEYLTELQTRIKWRRPSEDNLKVGTLVLIKNENSPTMSWQLGRITKLCPGKDGITRVVELKVSRGYLMRPVNKICVLPTEQ